MTESDSTRLDGDWKCGVEWSGVEWKSDTDGDRVAKTFDQQFQANRRNPGPTPRPGGALRRLHFLLLPAAEAPV